VGRARRPASTIRMTSQLPCCKRSSPLRKTIEAGLSRDAVADIAARLAARAMRWTAPCGISRPSSAVAPPGRSPADGAAAFADDVHVWGRRSREMAAAAVAYKGARAIKLKLTGEANDADRVRAVREARPDVWIGVDANQGFTRPSLERLMPTLTATKVELIEQPFPIGQEALLDAFNPRSRSRRTKARRAWRTLPGWSVASR